MRFLIEQIAICPPDHERAIAFLEELGAEFIRDNVVAHGSVFEEDDQENTAELAFDYQLSLDKAEFEVLHYEQGANWMQDYAPAVSHLGMHCTADELAKWKIWMATRGINIAQEVFTQSHTNDYVLRRNRKYHYCIFDTRPILGVDLKFIVRIQPAS